MGYCDWGDAPDRIAYHQIWGIPVHEDAKHFEYLSYEVLQCGLSWWLVYGKRAILRQCFDDFDVAKVAAYGEEDVQRILATPGMIRAEAKVRAIINNARCFDAIRREYGSFDAFLWAYTHQKTILYCRHEQGRIPASNALSARISRDLKARGFAYTGPIVVYSHLQAAGLINDHDAHCPCYARILAQYPCVHRRREGEQKVVDFGKPNK